MNRKQTALQFEARMAPHLDAAYNLACWLTQNPSDADDVAQEAYTRALRYFDGFRGGDCRAWLLSIVRNTFYTWVEQRRRGRSNVEYDDADIGLEALQASGDEALHAADPEKLMLREADQQLVKSALLKLAAAHREVLVLREMEELSYKEIAEITGIPQGTVMSRLSRAREQLRIHIELMIGR